MAILIGIIGFSLAGLLIAMSAVLWRLYRQGKNPKATKRSAFLCGAHGLLILVGLALYLTRAVAERPLLITFALSSVGIALYGRFQRSTN